MSTFKQYMCGYNGFQQISQCLDTSGPTGTCNLSENKTMTDGEYTVCSLLTNTENKRETSNSTNYKNSANHNTCGTSVQDYRDNISESRKHATSGNQDFSKEINSPESDISTPHFVCLPKLLRLKPVFWTWSQIWTQSPIDSSYRCHGYNRSCITTTLKNTCGSIPKPVTQVQGNNILVRNGDQYMIVNENATVAMETEDVDGVMIVEATKDKLYGTKDDEVYEGEMKKSCDSTLRISYKSLTMSVPIQSVSCGFDHTVILSKSGVVFSLGSGSRGQLGHGNVTVDYQCVPKKIQTFEGICVVTIATGGWHSCAVTDTGDLYVWGWNESGQLGLPNGSSVPHCEPDGSATLSSDDNHVECEQSVDEHVQQSGSWTHYENNTQDKELCNSEPVPPATLQHDDLDKACDSDCEPNVRKELEKLVQTKLYQSVDCVSNVTNQVKKPVKTRLYQSIDCVQIQTVPYGLDVTDEFSVKTVTCGSRHTCVLFDCGSLYTTGWNKYGQLCHDDRHTRDVLELVPDFTNHQYHVVDVKANCWNTLVTTEN